jgi:hypothetical protein
MSNNTNNIIVGGAEFAIGLGTPLVGVDGIVDAIKTASTGTPKDFRAWMNSLGRTSGVALNSTGITFYDVGFTQQGVEIAYNPDFGEVEVDQLLDAARLFRQKMSVSVKTTFAEATLENLVYVWDLKDTYQSTSADYHELYLVPGELGDKPNERVLAFAGNAPSVAGSTRQRLYVTTRAVSIAASSHGVKRSEATMFPVEFRLLPDGGSSYSSYGKLVDCVS